MSRRMVAGIPFDPERELIALCCECGTLRTLKRARYKDKDGCYRYSCGPSNGYGVVGAQHATSPSGNWDHQQRNAPAHLRSMVTPYDHYVCVAKCVTCDKPRARHAMLIAEEHRARYGDQLETEMLKLGIREPIEDPGSTT